MDDITVSHAQHTALVFLRLPMGGVTIARRDRDGSLDHNRDLSDIEQDAALCILRNWINAADMPIEDRAAIGLAMIRHGKSFIRSAMKVLGQGTPRRETARTTARRRRSSPRRRI